MKDHVVETNFGPVTLSKRTIAYLDDYHENWREIITTKRLQRSKRAKWVLAEVKRIEEATRLKAEIDWWAGATSDELKGF